MKLRTLLWTALCATSLTGLAVAQPPPGAPGRHEAARGAHPAPAASQEARKEAREEAREERKEAREEAKDAGVTMKPGPEGARERIQKLRETREERKRAHRAELLQKWGPDATRPAIRNELRVHAWRMARLQRVRLLAESEDKPSVVARVDKLLAREEERHATRMVTLGAKAAPPPGLSAQPSAMPPGQASAAAPKGAAPKGPAPKGGRP